MSFHCTCKPFSNCLGPNVYKFCIFKYLIDSFNQILRKPISKNEIISAYSGVRPLIKSKENFHKSSRDFFIQENDSLLTIFGGKWTTSPTIARKIVTMI